jgi:FkbM family methyltransferase
VVALPWGCPIEVDVRETIGRSIWTTGIYDLSVTEALVRLADRGSLAVDAGANIGAMTGALASRAAEVWAFEPHREVFQQLSGNVARFADRPGFARCQLFNIALSDTDGEARLEIPTDFDGNHGLARLSAEGGTTVRTVRLDSMLNGREIGVLKVDVEGHELNVFHGASDSLAAGRVRHIVFEDHLGPDSPVCVFLMGQGYEIFRIGWRLSGLVLAPPGTEGRGYEAPSYLATRDPEGALARCRTLGWESFRYPTEARRR